MPLKPVFFALLLAATTARADREVTHSFESAVPAGAVRRVIVDIPFGEVVVRNSSGGTIRLSGVARREYDNRREREKNRKIVEDASAEIYVNGDEAVVRRRFGPNARSWQASKFTEYSVRIEVPPGMALDVQTKAGEIGIEGIFGDVFVDLRAGEIDLRMPRKIVRELSASCRIGEVETDLGHEIVEREGILPGTTHFYNSDGHARVRLHTTIGEVRVVLTR